MQQSQGFLRIWAGEKPKGSHVLIHLMGDARIISETRSVSRVPSAGTRDVPLDGNVVTATFLVGCSKSPEGGEAELHDPTLVCVQRVVEHLPR